MSTFLLKTLHQMRNFERFGAANEPNDEETKTKCPTSKKRNENA